MHNRRIQTIYMWLSLILTLYSRTMVDGPPGLTLFFLVLVFSGTLSSLRRSFIEDPWEYFKVRLAGLLNGDPSSADEELQSKNRRRECTSQEAMSHRIQWKKHHLVVDGDEEWLAWKRKTFFCLI